jgi:hypothetical protein
MATILFVMANPFCDEWDSESNEELHQIRRVIREAKYRDRIQLVEAVAAEFAEIPALLAEHRPDVLHFAVPALLEYGLFFQELERGSPRPTVSDAIRHAVRPSAAAGPAGDALVDMLRTHAEASRLKVVIVNAPFSRRAATVLSQYVGTVIATEGDPHDGNGYASVHQDACVAFGKGFYEKLGSGAGIQESFLAGRRRVQYVLPSLPFGRAESYIVNNKVQVLSDLRLSEDAVLAAASRPPIRAMFWAAVGVSQRFRAALNLGREVREIRRKLLQGPNPDYWSLTVEWAVRRSEARARMVDGDPAILIISGHAERDGVLLYDDGGSLVEVNADELRGLLESAGRGVRCVVLNGCNTAQMAERIAGVSGFALGMADSIPDGVAVTFAEGFFMALAQNRSLVDAVEIAKASMQGVGVARDVQDSSAGSGVASGQSRWGDIPRAFVDPKFYDDARRPFLELFGIDG